MRDNQTLRVKLPTKLVIELQALSETRSVTQLVIEAIRNTIDDRAKEHKANADYSNNSQ